MVGRDCTSCVLHVFHVVLRRISRIRKYTRNTVRVQPEYNVLYSAHASTRHFQQSTWRILKYRVHDRVHNTVRIKYIPKYRTPYPDESTFTVHQEYTPEYGTAAPPSPCPQPPQSTRRVRRRVRHRETEYSTTCKCCTASPPIKYPPISYPR